MEIIRRVQVLLGGIVVAIVLGAQMLWEKATGHYNPEDFS